MSYKVLSQKDKDTRLARFATDVFLGLSRTKKVLQSKYMYDERGTELYEKIMELDEYYLVEAEYEALELAKDALYNLLKDSTVNLIELGAGNAIKTKILLKHFKEQNLNFRYIPIDISEAGMQELIDALTQEMPDLQVNGLVADYFDAFKEIHNSSHLEVRNFVLFLGSNIGNLTFDESTAFIFKLWQVLKRNDLLLIGFDLRKNIETMRQAYNDSKGITKEFNYNLLLRINRELKANFDLDNFEHYEPYNVYTGAMESYLISKVDQEVYIEALDRTFHFAKWEPIFVEWSYKYTEEDVARLASITGFREIDRFYDKKKYFLDSLWCVKREINDSSDEE